MITKQDIDTYFSKHYNDLNLYTVKYLIKTGRNYDADALISDSYIECTNKINKMTSISDIPAFAKQYIKMNIHYVTAPHALRNRIKDNQPTDTISHTVNDLTVDVEQIIVDFEKTLKRHEKNLFDMFYHKEINTAKKLSAHLNISVSSAYNTMKDVKDLEKRLERFAIAYIQS